MTIAAASFSYLVEKGAALCQGDPPGGGGPYSPPANPYVRAPGQANPYVRAPGRAGRISGALAGLATGLARLSAFFQRFGSSLSLGLGMLGAGGFLRVMAKRLAVEHRRLRVGQRKGRACTQVARHPGCWLSNKKAPTLSMEIGAWPTPCRLGGVIEGAEEIVGSNVLTWGYASCL
jgi:hypothetical protein